MPHRPVFDRFAPGSPRAAGLNFESTKGPGWKARRPTTVGPVGGAGGSGPRASPEFARLSPVALIELAFTSRVRPGCPARRIGSRLCPRWARVCQHERRDPRGLGWSIVLARDPAAQAALIRSDARPVPGVGRDQGAFSCSSIPRRMLERGAPTSTEPTSGPRPLFRSSWTAYASWFTPTTGRRCLPVLVGGWLGREAVQQHVDCGVDRGGAVGLVTYE